MPGLAVTLLWNFDTCILMLSYCFLYKSLASMILEMAVLSYLWLWHYTSQSIAFDAEMWLLTYLFLLTLASNYVTLFTLFTFSWHQSGAHAVQHFLMPGYCWLRVSGPARNAQQVHQVCRCSVISLKLVYSSSSDFTIHYSIFLYSLLFMM